MIRESWSYTKILFTLRMKAWPRTRNRNVTLVLETEDKTEHLNMNIDEASEVMDVIVNAIVEWKKSKQVNNEGEFASMHSVTVDLPSHMADVLSKITEVNSGTGWSLEENARRILCESLRQWRDRTP